MDSKLQVHKPDNIEITLTVTMSLQRWKKLSDQLEGGYYDEPSKMFRDNIKQMVNKCEKEFKPNSED